jgi:A-macroglobulin receptor
MLAEVGLPPGAEVERASLEAAKESGEGMSSYEVLPDRVEFYIWPTAGGSKFEFAFRVRYGMESWSAPSSFYDYYNPEAAAVMPVKFSIH